MRKRRAIISFVGIVLLTFVVYSYKMGNKEEVKFPASLYGIPTYQNARLSERMSSFDGDPYIAVFLSNDHHNKVIKFYEDKFKLKHEVLEYGRRNIVTLRIYRFQLKAGYLPGSMDKGVEIMPLNSRSQYVHNAVTKIKIILPRKEVLKANQKVKAKSNPDSTQN